MERNEETCTSKETEKSSEDVKKKPAEKKKDIETLLHHLYIAHELAVNEDLNVYVNPDEENDSDENIVRSTLREAYWNLFKDEISEDPPKLDMAFELLAEIKKGLELVMTPNITKLRNQVSQVLDLDTLRTEAEHGAVDVMYYAKYIIAIIGKICAPVRDKAVARLSKETDIVAIFRGIVEILSLMKKDLLSFSLAVIKPDIMANHLAYERDTFREYVLATGGLLPITSKWLSRHKDPAKSPKEIVHKAFIDLLTWNSAEPFPETLFLEEERLRKLRLDYFRLTVSCTLVFLSLGLVPQTVHSEENFKESIKTFITIMMSEARTDKDVKDLSKNIAAELISKITNSLSSKNDSATGINVEFKLFQETVEQASLTDNKIRILVCTRVNDYLRNSLSVRPTNDSHFPPALNLFKKEVSSLRLLFESVFTHNQLVCMEHYERLLVSNEEVEAQ